MPVRFSTTEKNFAARANRGRGFDDAISNLAPIIAKFQDDGLFGIQQIAERLNQAGLAAPSGERFSYTTTLRIIKRLAQMGLVSGAMTSAGSRRQAERRRRRS